MVEALSSASLLPKTGGNAVQFSKRFLVYSWGKSCPILGLKIVQALNFGGGGMVEALNSALR